MSALPHCSPGRGLPANFWPLLAVLVLTVTGGRGAVVGSEGSTAVIELAFVDEPGTPRARESASLRIATDGTIWIAPDAGGGLIRAGQMSAEELDGLCRELLKDGQLDRVDNRRLAFEIDRANRIGGFEQTVEGEAETVFRLRTAAAVCEVRCRSLSVMAARFPDFPELQRLLNVQLRLQNVAAVARAGGDAAGRQLAELANEELQVRCPGAAPLTTRDLSMFRELTTGARYVQFYRRPTPSSDELLVSLCETPGDRPRVTITCTPRGAK